MTHRRAGCGGTNRRAFAAVYDAADAKPEIFASLADKDDGLDPKKFETQLLRDRLERRNLIDEIATEAAPLASAFGDTVLALGERVAPVSRAAYKIGKAIAETDAELRTILAPAIDAYARPKKRPTSTPPAPDHCRSSQSRYATDLFSPNRGISDPVRRTRRAVGRVFSSIPCLSKPVDRALKPVARLPSYSKAN